MGRTGAISCSLTTATPAHDVAAVHLQARCYPLTPKPYMVTTVVRLQSCSR